MCSNFTRKRRVLQAHYGSLCPSFTSHNFSSRGFKFSESCLSVYGASPTAISAVRPDRLTIRDERSVPEGFIFLPVTHSKRIYPISTTKTRDLAFDALRDHPRLLDNVVSVMRTGATLFFSTNHQNFQPHRDDLRVSDVREITSRTIPEDYVHKRKTIHRCWQITV